MKFSIAYEHRQFFQKEKYIEFDLILTSSQVEELNAAIHLAVNTRLASEKSVGKRKTYEQFFMAGHDLWRDNETVKKIVTNPQLTQIGADLVETRDLRLGFDQYFPNISKKIHFTGIEKKYEDFLEEKLTLNELYGLEGIACGLLVCLRNAPEGSDESVFPKEAGNAIYIAPDYQIDFSKLNLNQQDYLLIVYTYNAAYYRLNEKDPHAHTLKHLGYHFGDKLNDKLNPIVYRSKGG